MSEPAFSGANVFLIQIGIRFATAGAIVCGMDHFRAEVGELHRLVMQSESMTVASGTRRGSALSTPSTSVQITISSASSRSPKIDAEKSLPFLPSVV